MLIETCLLGAQWEGVKPAVSCLMLRGAWWLACKDSHIHVGFQGARAQWSQCLQSNNSIQLKYTMSLGRHSQKNIILMEITGKEG